MNIRYKTGRITLSRLGRHAKYLARHTFTPPGRLPDVVIVGAMKCGTTSLFSYLCEHPLVHGSIRKEVHYFDRHFHRGARWYRKHFPYPDHGIVLEATPRYIFHQDALPRLTATLPRARLVVVLRNPVQRAYSHYHHSRREGAESRTFEAAVAADMKTYQSQGVLGDNSWNSNYHSYIRRGIYAPQVRRILDNYGSAVLVLSSEDLFAAPLAATNRVLHFLDLPPLESLSDAKAKLAGSYEPTIPLCRELEEFYLPHNDELFQLLGVDRWWPSNGFRSGTSVPGCILPAARVPA